VPVKALQKHWDNQAKGIKADRIINFSESIEVALAVHPRSPKYNYTKDERRALCDFNYYEYTMKWAGLSWETSDDLRPELYFHDKELEEASKHLLRPNHFNILVCYSGSGTHKAYTWMEAVMGDLLKVKDIHIITTGDLKCKLLEFDHPRVTNLSGDVSIRTSMALTGLVDLVISPDTGILHASGCYDTPKIGLLGHTTKNNITKHFTNDLSMEADSLLAECAPCFRLIYNIKNQCPVDTKSGGAWCMSKGISPELVLEKVQKVYENARSRETVTV